MSNIATTKPIREEHKGHEKKTSVSFVDETIIKGVEKCNIVL